MKAINCFIRFYIADVKHKIAKYEQRKRSLIMCIALYVVLKAAITGGKKKYTVPYILCKHGICGTRSTAKLHTEFKVFYKLLPYTPKLTLPRISFFNLKFCVGHPTFNLCGGGGIVKKRSCAIR